MDSSLSLPSSFDNLLELYNISDQSRLEEFLRFVTSQEDCRIKWLEAERELQKQKKTQRDMKREINYLDLKLYTARKLLYQEKNKRIKAEEEKNTTARQLQLVRELLFAGDQNHLHDETREKLKFLNSMVRSRMSNDYNDRLSVIQELDSTGSILSELSFSRSEDDLDVESFLRRKRTYKKQRPSNAGCEEIPSAKPRRSSRVFELNKNDTLAEHMVATTTVTMEHDGSMSAQSQIETTPSVNYAPSGPIRTGSLESGLSIENNTKYNQDLNKDVGVLPIGSSKINTPSHLFTFKFVIRPEECDVCEKRIKFSCTVLRCQNCRASCHPSCKEELPLPCIAPGKTPISKTNMGVVADYAPSCPPMVPALVIHCVREVEDRGLTEPGIYRLSGSDKVVKALKERFMRRNRGVPRLVDLDIHVVCGCLKDFLQSLREPLVTHRLWWEFVQGAEICDLEEQREKLYQAVSQLPQPNRDTLAYIILHLLRVAESKEANKMDVTNLATVMGPTVVGYSSDCNSEEMYSQDANAKMVLEQFLLMSADYWFGVMSNPHVNIICATPPTRSQRTPSTQVVVGPEGEIYNLVARWPGSVYDSRIFDNCALKVMVEGGELQVLLLGDSGYAQTEFLFTPAPEPVNNREARYNRSDRTTRSCIERCFGRWKRRFPCISQGLRTKEVTILHIISSCTVLHKISMQVKEVMPECEEFDNPFQQPRALPQNDRARGRAIRNAFITTHF